MNNKDIKKNKIKKMKNNFIVIKRKNEMDKNEVSQNK